MLSRPLRLIRRQLSGNVTPFNRRLRGGSWDGIYQSSSNLNCDATAGDFAQSFADSAVGDFEVRNNQIVGHNIAIDEDGSATYSVNIGGVSVTVNYNFTATGGGEVLVSGDFAVSISEEASVSCDGTFSGSRISL